jgi:hypothetical protein
MVAFEDWLGKAGRILRNYFLSPSPWTASCRRGVSPDFLIPQIAGIYYSLKIGEIR